MQIVYFQEAQPRNQIVEHALNLQFCRKFRRGSENSISPPRPLTLKWNRKGMNVGDRFNVKIHASDPGGLYFMSHEQPPKVTVFSVSHVFWCK